MTSLAKLWIFLLTLLCGLLALAFLLSPAQVRRSLERTEADRLELAQEAAQLLLQNSARLWVDTAAQVAGDAILQSTLEETTRNGNESEPELVYRTAQDQLRKLNQALKVSFLILTDSRGKVLARAGRDEATHQDSLIGYPLVADAVRGYRLDDLWFQDGTLYRMAAAPVISPERDRYVGAVILGQAVTTELAQQLHKGLGVDVVFLCGGQVVASSRDRVPQELAALAADHGTALSQGGHTDALPVAGNTEVALLSGLPGEAAAQDAALGLLSPGPAATSIGGMLTALVESVGRGDLPYARLPALGGAMALAFLVGLLLLHSEVEAPFARLLRELHRPPLSPERYRGPWQKLAAAINHAVTGAAERATQDAIEAAQATMPLPAAALRSLPALSAAPSRGGIAEPVSHASPAQPSAASPKATQPQPVPTVAAPAAPPRPAAHATPRPAPAHQASSMTQPDLSAFAESAATQPSLPMAMTSQAIPVVIQDRPTGGRQPAKTESSLPVPLKLPGPLPSGAIPSRPVPDSARTLHDPNLAALLQAEEAAELADNPTMRDIPPSLVQAAIESALESAPATFKGPLQQALRARTLTGPISSAPVPGQRVGAGAAPPQGSAARTPAPSQVSPAGRSLSEEPTAVSGLDGRLAQQRETEEELEAAFRQTYQEFVVTKQRCNEPVEGLTFEKFAVKLRQSRDQIMKQHKCRTVRFHVYVKDGKAALKATPVAR